MGIRSKAKLAFRLYVMLPVITFLERIKWYARGGAIEQPSCGADCGCSKYDYLVYDEAGDLEDANIHAMVNVAMQSDKVVVGRVDDSGKLTIEKL